MKLKTFIGLILLSLAFLACDETRVFEQNIDIEDKVWNENTIPDFSFRIEDPQKSYNIYYNFRNTRSYPFRNLYVQYTLEDSLGTKISTDLHNIDLFDPITGKPYGSGLGDIFDHQVLAVENFKFKEPGSYKFKIQQFMRMENLPEILSVGMRIEQTND